MDDIIKLDYSIQSSEERNKYVKQLFKNYDTQSLPPSSLTVIADYILFPKKKPKKENKKNILTENRLITINKRETSFEGLVGKFENGEDGIYNLISDLGKNMRLTKKAEITEKDIAETPGLRDLRCAIEDVEKEYSEATGKRKYLLKKQIIEMRQEQYLMRSSHKNGPVYNSNMAKAALQADFYDNITLDKDNNPVNSGLLSFFNPKHIEALLCNYSKLKEEAYGNFKHDLWYLMEDLDNLIEQTLREEYPLYYDLLIAKIDGKTNAEIQSQLDQAYSIKHSIEYISSLWRNKIPRLLAEQAQKNYLIWYYTTQEYGEWKRCSRCGEIKLAHAKFFSRNSTSKDGWYSLCKECRNANSVKNQKKIEAKRLYLEKKEGAYNGNEIL